MVVESFVVILRLLKIFVNDNLTVNEDANFAGNTVQITNNKVTAIDLKELLMMP